MRSHLRSLLALATLGALDMPTSKFIEKKGGEPGNARSKRSHKKNVKVKRIRRTAAKSRSINRKRA